MAAASEDAQEKIQRLTLIEQNLQQLLHQKQQFSAQQFEIESAEKELKDAPNAYKIIGNIMVQRPLEDLRKDLGQRKEIIDLRLASIEKQEVALKEKAKKLQEDVLGSLKGAEAKA